MQRDAKRIREAGRGKQIGTFAIILHRSWALIYLALYVEVEVILVGKTVGGPGGGGDASAANFVMLTLQSMLTVPYQLL